MNVWKCGPPTMNFLKCFIHHREKYWRSSCLEFNSFSKIIYFHLIWKIIKISEKVNDLINYLRKFSRNFEKIKIPESISILVKTKWKF